MDAASLRDRLRGIVKPAGLTNQAGTAGEGGQAGVESGVPGRRSVGREGGSRTLMSLAETLGGAWRGMTGGGSFVVSRRFAPHDLHGDHRIEQFAADLREASSAATLLGAASAQPPFVFFDLETTGLNGGAGTHAFLVGLGWFDADGGFVTEQHLMTEYAGERPMLHAVGVELGRAGTLLTFNGKSFDAPMLETRYLFHRLQSPCTARPHVDLLHPARRFWGPEAEAGCSLSVLERRVLGVQRAGDVAGFEIPARYFQFIRNGDARPLLGIFDHNRLDLLSLAGLTGRIFHLVKAGPAEAQHSREALALGRVYTAAALDERAEEAFERAVALSGPRSSASRPMSMCAAPRKMALTLLRLEALRALAIGARRQRRYEAAAARWRELLEVPGCPGQLAREATRALAIHHEHRARDLSTAKEFALKGLELEVEAAYGDAARHRLARIERKISERRSLFPSSPSQLPPSFGSPMSGRRTSS